MGSQITLSGFNNIDFKAITDIIIRSERQPITRLEADKRSEQNKLTAYGSLNTSLSALRSAFAALSSTDAYEALKAVPSDSSVLSASATSEATAGTFTLNVTSLARPQVTTSGAGQFSDINAAIFDNGSFSITQDGETTNVDLTGVDSLAELRDAINAQQTGVKASIINDGSGTAPFRFVLTSVSPGVANAFTVSDTTKSGAGAAGAVLNLNTDATNGVAKDTEFTYNGIPVKSSSTIVDQAIPGLSLNILKTGNTSVTVSGDHSDLKSKIKAAVSAFNSFNDFFAGQTKLDTTGSGRPPLASDPLLRSANRQLRTFFLNRHANTGSVDELLDLGITLDQQGKLQIDDAKLDSVLSANRADLAAFLSGNSGFAKKITDAIDGYTKSGGAIDSVEDRIRKNIDKYTSRIQDLEFRLATREQQLAAEFAAADRAISQLNSQSSSLAGLSSQFRLF